MTHPTRPVALAALAVLAASSASLAQDPPAKAELVLKANPGKPVHYVFTHETAQKLPLMGETVDSTATGTTEFSIEVKEVAADGTATGVVRFGRMVAALSNPVLGEKSFDSAAEPPSDEMEQLMSAAVVGLARAEFTVTFDAGGAITKVDGVEAAREAAAKRLAANAMTKRALAMTISESGVRDHIAWALVATPIPAGTVTVGQSWEDSDTIPGTARGVSIKTKLKLTTTTIDAERVSLSGTGTLDVQARLSGGDADIKETACAATLDVSRADGLPTTVTSSLSMSAELAKKRGPMTQTTKTSTKRVAAWPSSEKEKQAPAAPATPETPAPAGK